MDAGSFEAIVGAEHCRIPAREALDGVPISEIVAPADASEVALCLAEARESGRSVLPRGGGSKLGWGNRSVAPDLVRLDLARLVQPLELDADEGIVTVAAGVSVDVLESRAAELGKRTLLSALHAGATIGGTIAADPIDPRCGPGTRLRDDILGIRVAHPDGSQSRAGGQVVKNVTGFDLVRLYCGSFGTLGVITEATLRLRPLPEARATGRRDHAGWRQALEHAQEILRLEPRTLMLLPEGERVRALFELEGTEKDVGRRMEQSGGEPVAPLELESAGKRLADVAEGEAGSPRVKLRLGARASDTEALVSELEKLAGSDAVSLALPRAGIVLAWLPEDALPGLLAQVERAAWTVLIEWARPDRKVGLDVFGPAPDALVVMRALKRRFDPEAVLAPGRFVGGI